MKSIQIQLGKLGKLGISGLFLLLLPFVVSCANEVPPSIEEEIRAMSQDRSDRQKRTANAGSAQDNAQEQSPTGNGQEDANIPVSCHIQGGNTSPSSPRSSQIYKYYLVQGQCRPVLVSDNNSHGFTQQSECEAACGSARSEREAEENLIATEYQKIVKRSALIDEGKASPPCGLKEAEKAREKRSAEHQELIKQGRVPAHVSAECNIRGGTCFNTNSKEKRSYYLVEGQCRLVKVKSCNIHGFIRKSDCEATCQ